jgi:hypothetical protein
MPKASFLTVANGDLNHCIEKIHILLTAGVPKDHPCFGWVLPLELRSTNAYSDISEIPFKFKIKINLFERLIRFGFHS